MLTWSLTQAIFVAATAGIAAGSHAVDPASSVRTNQGAQQHIFAADPHSRVLTFSGSRLRKWSNLLSRHDAQIASNRSEWGSLVASLQETEKERLLDEVNLAVNRTRYLTDGKVWGTDDYWATPQEFFSKGGDCEDFAIAKYLILRELGVEAIRMHLAISDDHAILVVMTSAGPVTLDNRYSDVRPLRHSQVKRLKFTVNEISWSIKLV